MSADHQTRVRVGVPNSELLADATTVKKEINEVGVGSFKMTFNHDMTSSFKWGGIILLLIILKVVRKGKAAFTDEPTASGAVTSQMQEAELHEFTCSTCSYTLFPARGREGKFFPDDFKCPQCDAPKEAFFDMNDATDERTQKAMLEDEDFEYTIQEVVLPSTPAAAPAAPPPAPPPPPPVGSIARLRKGAMGGRGSWLNSR